MISFEKIKKSIDEWDPVNLLYEGAPSDEYDIESKELFVLIQQEGIRSPKTLSLLIHSVFLAAFGSELFKKSTADCEHIAMLIISNVKVDN